MSSSAQLKTNSKSYLNEYLNQNQPSTRYKTSSSANKITFNATSFKMSNKKGLTLQTDLTMDTNSDYSSMKRYDSSFENPSSKSPAIPPAADENYNSTLTRAFEPSSSQRQKEKQSARSNRFSKEEAILKKLFFNSTKNVSSATPSQSAILESFDNRRGIQSNRVLKVETDLPHSSNDQKESSYSHQILPKSALLNSNWDHTPLIHPTSVQAYRSSQVTYQNLFSSRQNDTSPERTLLPSKSRRDVLIKTYGSNAAKAKQRPSSTTQKQLPPSKSSNQSDFATIIRDIKKDVPTPEMTENSTYEDKKNQYKLRRNEEGAFELGAPKDNFNQILRGNAKVPTQQLKEIQSSLKGIPIGASVSQKIRKVRKPTLEKESKPFISIIDHQQPQQSQDPAPNLSDFVSNSNGLLKSNSQEGELNKLQNDPALMSGAFTKHNKTTSEPPTNRDSSVDSPRLEDEKSKPSGFKRTTKGANSFVESHRKNKSSSKEKVQLVPVKPTVAKPLEKINCAYYMDSLRRHWINFNDQDEFCRLYRGHFCQIYHEASLCKSIRPTELTVLEKRKISLPKRESHKDKKTLILDLDETLIHCNSFNDLPADITLPIKLTDGTMVRAGINIRPFAVEFLKEMSELYEIIVFTASHSCYANVILDYLDPNNEYVHHRLFRESCISLKEGPHVKDLRIIKDRNLSDVVIVDNSANSFAFQMNNGIPIIPYYDNKADRELIDLMEYLKLIYPEPDLRLANRRFFQLQAYAKHPTPKDVLDRVVFKDY